MEQMKTCSKCKRELPASSEYFGKHKGGKFGLRSVCKSCRIIEKKEYHEKNREKILLSQAKYRNEHKLEASIYVKKYYQENKDKIAEYARQRYQNQKEKILEQTKKYYWNNVEKYREIYKVYKGNNKEKIAKRNKEWQRNNPEQSALKTQRRRAKERQLISTYTTQEWEECKLFFNNKCAYCGEEVKLTIDHIIPVNKGGHYIKQNLIPACGTCNRSKTDKDLETWYRKQLFFNEQKLDKIHQWMGVENNQQQLKII